LIKYEHNFENEFVVTFDYQTRVKNELHNLRILLYEGCCPADDNIKLDFIYSSEHGLIINGDFMTFSLINATDISIIGVKGNDSDMILYLTLNGMLFSDIFYFNEVNYTGPLKLAFDSSYSDNIEISGIRYIDEALPESIKK
jgi:hypothetical protein